MNDNSYDVYRVLDETRAIMTMLHNVQHSTDKKLQFFSKRDTYNATIPYSTTLSPDKVIIKILDADTLIDFRYIHNICSTLQSNIIAVDFETTSTDTKTCEVLGLGISDGTTHYYFVNYDNQKLKTLLVELALKYMLVAHFASFEYAVARNELDIELNDLHDTAILLYLQGHVSNQLKLKTLSSRYLERYPLDWVELCTNHSIKPIDGAVLLLTKYHLKELAAYCAEDALETWLLWQKFVTKLTKEEWELYEIEISLTKTLVKMTDEGIKINKEILKTLQSDLVKGLDDVLNEFKKKYIFNTEINIFSPAQLQTLFYKTWKIDPNKYSIRKTKTGYSVDSETRSLLSAEHPGISLINDAYTLRKALNTYVNPYLNGKDVLYPKFNQTITRTGRLSSSQPNYQNIPNPDKYTTHKVESLREISKIRNLIWAKDNHSIVSIDYSSFEIVIAAELSQDKTLLDVCASGKSLHDVIASKLLSIPLAQFAPKEDKHHKFYRTLAKNLNFLCFYLGSEQSFKKWVNQYILTNKDVPKLSDIALTQIYKQWWEALPEYAEWTKLQQALAIKNGYTTSLGGRRRFFTFTQEMYHKLKNYNLTVDTVDKFRLSCNSFDASQLRQSVNFPVQASNADIIKLAMIQSHKVLNDINKDICNDVPWEPNPKARMLLQVHDELVFEVPQMVLNETVILLKDTMINAAKRYIKTLPVNVSASFGKGWGDCK